MINMQELKYKKNLESVVKRNKLFWTGNYNRNNLIKIEIENNSVFDTWVRVLSPEYCPDFYKMFDVFIDNFKTREYLLDDAIPTARPSFGSSAYGAFFGGEIIFGKTGGYSKPLLSDIKNFKKPSYDFNNFWLKRQIEATKYFVKKAKGLCSISIIETMDSLNLAENLFGSLIYVHLIDFPKEVLKIFDFAFEFNIKLIEEQRKHIKKILDGYSDIHEEWLPGNAIWLSIDTWSQCSIDIFKKLGKQHLQEIINYFGGGWLHMHNSALHLLEEVSKVKGLLGIGIIDDPKQNRCLPRLREIQKITRDMPLQINCTKDEFINGLKNKTLPRNIMYWIDKGVKTIEEANKLVELVYEY